jgi:hypothetical protein
MRQDMFFKRLPSSLFHKIRRLRNAYLTFIFVVHRTDKDCLDNFPDYFYISPCLDYAEMDADIIT